AVSTPVVASSGIPFFVGCAPVHGAQGFGQRSSEAFSAVASAIAAAGIAVALREIYEGYMECIEVASGFEESMSNVKALSGATADELEDLGGLAKELGATTKFTAKESADAMGYMAMAGWNAEQMLSGMPGVLQLAAASDEDLALVSDIVTDSLTAFGLTASDTSRYADILAQTATKANTNVALMGETFKYAAPLAGALKYDVEDVAVATGLMANAGIKGSEAGTTLRNMFTRLAKPTQESAHAMDKLGLSMSDGTGKMYTWMELMEQMRDSFAGLTEEQKTFYAVELAGQRGMSGLLAIVNASEEDFNKLSTAISNSSGAAQRMADIKLDNLNGQITLFNSALEATKTTIGEQLNPTMEELYGIGMRLSISVFASSMVLTFFFAMTISFLTK
ncbi:MAG: phage tail tape measure protein, partial [Synergistaceae bacterium]|nr:phage tail tape measure protein [Synergistaceae bacterium]